MSGELEEALVLEQSVVEHARLLIASIYESRVLKVIDTNDAAHLKARDELRAKIIFLVKSKRLFQIHDLALLTEIWDEIRKASTLTDFILSATIELRLRVKHGDEGMVELIDCLAKAYAGMKTEKSIIDNSTLSRLASKEDWAEWMTDNNWLVVILLLDTVL